MTVATYMNAAKKIIVLLWLVLASVGYVSALASGPTENRTCEKFAAGLETRQADLLQTADRHQENGGVGYDAALDSLVVAENKVASGCAYSVAYVLQMTSPAVPLGW